MIAMRNGLICLSLTLCCAAACAEPPMYTATDITDWTPAQLASLPFFKRLNSPPSGPGVPASFSVAARSASGFIAGQVPQGTPYAGNEATLLVPAAGNGYTAAYIDPFGTYSWGYWSCDPRDCHYYFGYVRDSIARDVNFSGVMVGGATVGGSGDHASGASYHAYRYAAGVRVDIFPNAENAQAYAINNRGEIAAYAYGAGSPNQGGIRRAPDGTVTVLDRIDGRAPLPRWINANGVIIGEHYPSRAFASSAGARAVDLPALGSFPTVTANDLTDTGWIVGKCGNFNDPESFATIWEPNEHGTWTAHDLVEQLITPDILLENALVIDNAGNIIATGHEDGNDNFGSRRYWLAPSAPLAGWCRPDIGIHPADTIAANGAAEFSITVVNAADVTGYQWRLNGSTINPAQNASATTAVLTLAGLSPADSGGVYDCIASSACGDTTSASAVLIVEIACPADWDSSGGVDGDDIGAFFTDWQSGNADIDQSGGTDGDDITFFFERWQAGC